MYMLTNEYLNLYIYIYNYIYTYIYIYIYSSVYTCTSIHAYAMYVHNSGVDDDIHISPHPPSISIYLLSATRATGIMFFSMFRGHAGYLDQFCPPRSGRKRSAYQFRLPCLRTKQHM